MSEPARAIAMPSAAVEEFRAKLLHLIEENESFRNQLTELSETLSTAVTTHRSGDLVQAEARYRGMLTKLPNHPQALHMLGVIELQRGNVQSAIEQMSAAWRTMPGAGAE